MRWPASVAFVSQSGALVTAVLDWAKSRRIGFSHLVSLGERADVDFGDLLDYLASDARTRSILLYIESIEAPRKFMSAARAAARNKPVIVVKAGRAGNGVKAAASHTGALAGSDMVFDAAIRRAGMLRVDTLQDLFMAAETLARFGGNRDEALTIMTNGGGAGVMAADAAALAGVAAARAERRRCARALDAVLPPTWSRANPIDIIGDAPVRALHRRRCRRCSPTATAGAVLFMHAPTAIVRSDDIARACAPLVRAGDRPRDGLLARRRRGGRGAAHLRRRRRRRLRHARRRRCAPSRCSRTYRRNQALLHRGADRERERRRPTSPRRARVIDGGARRGPRDARRARSQGGAAGLRHPGRARRSRSGRRPMPPRPRRARSAIRWR